MRTIADIIYRDARRADAGRIAAQGRAAFIETFGHAYTDAEMAGYFAQTYGPGKQAAEIADPAFALHVAQDAAGIVAHVAMGPMALPIDTGGDRPIELKRLYLLARAQGSGIAQALVAWAADWSGRRGADAIYLSCWTQNPRAIRFYQRQGFVIVGHNRFAVGMRIDDDHILRLAL